jgi:N-acyl-L-homoserine lactone synthetase
MISLIDSSMGAASDTVLRNMFAARKGVFVDLLGWDVPVVDGRFEIDQFDDENARYLILTDDDLNHLGSARLLPTTQPHLLDTLFPALCAGPVPRGPNVFEITRFCLSRGLSGSERREVRNRLVTALVEFAIANGIATYTGVAELPWLRQILEFGWEAVQLGQPLPSGGRPLGALRIGITSATQAQLQAKGIWHSTDRRDCAPAGSVRDAAATIDCAARKLREEGWCILRDLVPGATMDALAEDLRLIFDETPFCSGDFYGARTKRFGSLLRRSGHAARLIQHPQVLGLAENVLLPWCDTIQLNLAQAIALHPGAPLQFPHRDQDMWQGVKGEVEYLVNVMWPLTRFTEKNGATQIFPASHGAQALREDWTGGAVSAECGPGDAIVFLGSTLHGAGANQSEHVRDALVASYCLGWLKPYENQWLAYPPAIARRFDPALAGLVGYRQHRPNLGNYEGVCPSVLLGDDVPEHIGAIDALRPEQVDAVAEHRRVQELG